MSEWLIHHELERQAAWRPSKRAVHFEGREWTYGEFNRRVNRVARALQSLGFEPGDIVAPHSKNHPDLYTLFLACSKAGFVYSPISTFQSERNIEYICEEMTPAVICYTDNEEIRDETLPTIRSNAPDAAYLCLDAGGAVPDESLEAISADQNEGNPSTELEDGQKTCHNLFWTSGTTGQPKGVIRNHRNSLHFSNPLAEHLPFDTSMRRLIHNDMMFVAPYLSEGLPTMMGGGTFYMVRDFSVEKIVDAIQRHDITDIHLAFTKTKLLAEHVENEGITLEIPRVQTALPNRKIAEKLAELSDKLFHSYATTEVGRPLVKHVEAPFDGRPPIGKPGQSGDVRIVTTNDQDAVPETVPEPGVTGEIAVKGDITMTRYLRGENQESLVHDGWVHTGDMGQLTDEGEVNFMGRKDDRIRTGGINVYPSEIENAISNHPDVDEVVVVGIEDELWGERVCCLVVTDRSDREAFEAELDERYRESGELADEVRPKEYVFLESSDEIPTSAVNKVDRGEVRALFDS